MRKLLLAAMAALCTETAIAEVTPYQPSTFSKSHSGYSEMQIDTNRVRVVFAGEAGTDRESVESNLLYRSAETTLQRGYDYFTVVTHDVETLTETKQSGPPLPPMLPKKRNQEVVRYQAVSEIVMHKGVRPLDNTSAYDARTVQTNLAWRISRPR